MGNTYLTTVPSNDYIITFEQRILPETVCVFNNDREVQKYINPVLICVNCCRYGHSRANCRGKTRCGFFTKDHLMFLCEKKKQALKKLPYPDEHLNNPSHICN